MWGETLKYRDKISIRDENSNFEIATVTSTIVKFLIGHDRPRNQCGWMWKSLSRNWQI